MYLFQQNERYTTIPIVRVVTAQLLYSTLLRRMQLKLKATAIMVCNPQQTRANMHVYIMTSLHAAVLGCSRRHMTFVQQLL